MKHAQSSWQLTSFALIYHLRLVIGCCQETRLCFLWWSHLISCATKSQMSTFARNILASSQFFGPGGEHPAPTIAVLRARWRTPGRNPRGCSGPVAKNSYKITLIHRTHVHAVGTPRRRRRRRWQCSKIKSNNPHLTGGEKSLCSCRILVSSVEVGEENGCAKRTKNWAETAKKELFGRNGVRTLYKVGRWQKVCLAQIGCKLI